MRKKRYAVISHRIVKDNKVELRDLDVWCREQFSDDGRWSRTGWLYYFENECDMDKFLLYWRRM